MATMAFKLRDGHVVAAGDGHTIVLVVNNTALNHNVARCADIEAVGIVRSRQAIANAVGGIARSVVQDQVLEDKIRAAGDGEKMHRPVLDMQVLDHGVSSDLLDHNEMVRLRHPPVGTLTVPVCLSITINDCSRIGSDRDACTTDGHWVERG